MGYRIRISAMIVILAWASTSFAQESDNEDQPKRDFFKTAAVVAGAALVIVSGYKIVKHIDKKALREAVEKVSKQAKEDEQALREKLAIARKQAEELRGANDILTAEATDSKTSLKQAEANHKQAKATEQALQTELEAAHKQAEDLRRANDILTVEADAAAVARQRAEVIKRGEALQQKARKGEKLSAAELQAIYEGRVAALAVEKAKELVAIHKQYPPDKHSPEDIAAAVQRRDEELSHVNMRTPYDIKMEFIAKYPRYAAIERLEAKHQQDLAEWHKIYDVAKDLTDGIPVMRYAPEFTDKMSAIIDATPIATELSDLVKVGGLQEVVWRLDEGGFATEATAMQELIEDVLTNAKIVSMDDQSLEGSTGAQLLEFDSGLRGVFKGYWEREVAVYRFDQLIGLNVFPITVPRRMDGYQGNGSVQLFIDGANGDFHRQYASYAKLIGIPETDRPYAKNRTFSLLMLDIDSNPSNNLATISGRTMKIDAGQAFSNKYSADEIKENIKNAQYYLDDDFIARLDRITPEQLEAIFQPLFEPEISEEMVSALHANMRRYVEAARQLAE